LVLGGTEEQELTVAEAEDAGFIASAEDPVEEALAKAVAARGRQKNLSFFAFTATPKARTLELFGTYNQATGKFEPFHLYSMRQAIEEGFILDVLANYTTYKTYWRIEKTVIEDPEYATDKANRAIARFVDLHPYNLAQKAEIIVEHFRAHTAQKIGGMAKAMVVTSSRLHAVRYWQAITKYIAEKKYTDLRALVAFSGTVYAKGLSFTEHGLNGYPESETAERFGEEYQVLIVAEKFQTGFDQPLLHTMYVDKVLTGLNAVQTLSRLNRVHPAKSDTFVLDFRNEADDIVKAFEPYYGETVAPPTDPNLLYDTRRRLDDWDVLRSRGDRGRCCRARHHDGTEGPRAFLRHALSRSRTVRRARDRRPGRVQAGPGQVRPHLLVPEPGRLLWRYEAGTRLSVLSCSGVGDSCSCRRRWDRPWLGSGTHRPPDRVHLHREALARVGKRRSEDDLR
jgi:type I site-specific restriction-modification system R (restriction) subunit